MCESTTDTNDTLSFDINFLFLNKHIKIDVSVFVVAQRIICCVFVCFWHIYFFFSFFFLLYCGYARRAKKNLEKLILQNHNNKYKLKMSEGKTKSFIWNKIDVSFEGKHQRKCKSMCNAKLNFCAFGLHNFIIILNDLQNNTTGLLLIIICYSFLLHI